MTKADLLLFLKQLPHNDIKVSYVKNKLINYVLDNKLLSQLSDYLGNKYIVVPYPETIQYFLFLYSGRTSQTMNVFILRDLGLTKSNDNHVTQRFEDKYEADECYYYQRYLSLLKHCKTIDKEKLSYIINDAPQSDCGIELRAKALFKIGQILEKTDKDEAIEVYALSSYEGAQERLIRLIYNAGQDAQAKLLLEQVIDDPTSDSDYLFAIDFYARKYNGQRAGYASKILNSAEVISLDESYMNDPEMGVVDCYINQGCKSYCTENKFWLSLFGLIFKQEIESECHSFLDCLPHSLKHGKFKTLYSASISKKIKTIKKGAGLALINGALSKTNNPITLVRKDYIHIDLIKSLMANYPHETALIIEAIANDFRKMKDGFPDIAVIQGDNVEFIEVKATGDVIRKNQLVRIKQLNEFGLSATVVNAQYRYNPNQEYVVVDIETTGGKKPYHRITEIGAVKVATVK